MAERIDADQRRLLLVDAAVEEVLAHGWSGTSLARIAARAGLSRAGVLHHFPTKAALLAAVLEVRDDRDVREAGLDLAALATQHTGRPVAQLFSGLRTLMWLNAGRPETVRLFTLVVGEAVAAGHPNAGWVQARYERLRDAIAEVLEAGVEAEEIEAAVDPWHLAARLIALMDGLQLQWLHAPEGFDLVAAFEAALDGIAAELALSRDGEQGWNPTRPEPDAAR